MPMTKWWGWGEPGEEFTDADKPGLAPFIAEVIDLDVGAVTARPVAFHELAIPDPSLPASLRTALERAVGTEAVSIDPGDRLIHGRGKSLRDLVRQRRGELGRLPDVVVRPADERAVAEILAAALDADAVLIPFGGGTSISGSLEAPADEGRPVVSVDLARLDRVLELDRVSRLARVQAGVLGPELERQLAAQGHTCGHFPDSFTLSTLGGWIATRSSGMQSDRYGDIADITKGLRVATPSGVLAVQPIPAMSNGPSVREMVLGSEGRLGVITEATIQVRRTPPRRLILGYLFPSFSDGLAAIREIAESECDVSVTRLSDAAETRFSFALRQDPTWIDELSSRALRAYLARRRGFAVADMCLSFIGYEGTEGHVRAQRRAVRAIVSRHGGVGIGGSPGRLYDRKKFDTPYIRDYLLDRGAVGDVSETAMPWSRLAEVYDAVGTAARDAFSHIGVRGYLMCHLSHSYHAGACLYFTFAFAGAPDRDMLDDYTTVKDAVQQAFVDHGATLSHHHAVGTEHARWLEQDISPAGVAMVQGLFAGVDPGRNLNPGKIVI